MFDHLIEKKYFTDENYNDAVIDENYNDAVIDENYNDAVAESAIKENN